MNQEQIYFTNVNKDTGIVTGYKVGEGFMATKMWQINVKNSDSEQFHQVRSQYQTFSSVEPEHYQPTTHIGTDNSMIYKYLDSNLFAVSTFDA